MRLLEKDSLEEGGKEPWRAGRLRITDHRVHVQPFLRLSGIYPGKGGKASELQDPDRCFILTKSTAFKYNGVYFVWNWNICKGFFVLFLIYNLTDLFHQNKHLLNVMEMVLKSVSVSKIASAKNSPQTRQHLYAEHTRPTPKLEVFSHSQNLSHSCTVMLPFLLSELKTCRQTLPCILHKQGTFITPISLPLSSALMLMIYSVTNFYSWSFWSIRRMAKKVKARGLHLHRNSYLLRVVNINNSIVTLIAFH